ncbi:MAG: ABC transporter permease [Chlorobaculum sp.]|nr:ABC transporter permease [Chlorobaculum sp.]
MNLNHNYQELRLVKLFHRRSAILLTRATSESKKRQRRSEWKGVAPLSRIINNQNFRSVLLGLVLPVVLVVLLEVVTAYEVFPPQLVIAPHRVFATFIELLGTGELQSNFQISMFRVLSGFLVGASLGFALGALTALFSRAERIISPLLIGISQVPLFGWVPLLMLWFGIGESFKVVFIAFGAFFPMLINTFEGIRGVPGSYIEVARTFGFSKVKLLRQVLLPAAVPSIFTGIKLALGMSWMLVVGAELIAAGEGVGFMIVWGRQLMQMDIVYVGIFVVGIVGYLMYLSLNAVESSLMRWRRR